MTRVYAITQFTDSAGTHQPGEALDVPEGTEAEQHELNQMINYGLVTRERPASSSPVEGAPASGGDDTSEATKSGSRKRGSGSS